MSAGTELCLIRAERQTFTGPAEFLRDPVQRADAGAYLADMARPYARVVPPGLFGEPLSPALGHSYGEMGQSLLGPLVTAEEPVDLLVLAFSVHDLWPSRATAAYLSRLCPGTPMSFAICDQGSAAAFSGLRIAREYAASAGCRRTLLIVVEQAALPYACAATVPSRHCGVAMLYGDCTVPSLVVPNAVPSARVVEVRQYPDRAAEDVADLAVAALAELSAGHRDVRLVLSEALAAVWSGLPADRAVPDRAVPRAVPDRAVPRVRVAPPGQPSTGVWWELIGTLADGADRADNAGAAGADLVVAADYDAGLRYLCLVAVEPS